MSFYRFYAAPYAAGFAAAFALTVILTALGWSVFIAGWIACLGFTDARDFVRGELG